MKFLPLFLLALLPWVVNAQSNPEVYLGDVLFSDGTISVSNLINISQNPGYDNQPSFLLDGTGVLFSSSRENGQTDVALFDISTSTKNWLTNSNGLSEYSPVQTPDKRAISFIILAEDGTQQFWKTTAGNPDPEILEKDDVVGYYTWYNADTYFCFVLPTDSAPSTLQKHQLSTGQKEIIAQNPGRSIHIIPGTKKISYVDKNGESAWLVTSYNPENRSTIKLTETPVNSEDMVWIDDENFLIGKGNTLLVWNSENGYSTPVKLFEETGSITRLALSPDGQKIALVFAAEE